MNYEVRNKFISKGAIGRAEMIGCVRQFVTNDQFVNLLQNVDINDTHIKNKNNSTSIYFICQQLYAFNGMTELCVEVKNWLAAV